MTDLERCINDPAYLPVDPLIKMAVIHHQFERIHPFYDGNGRTGRIVNVLYLVKEGLLDLPILSMSRQILRTRADYYRLLRDSRASGNWEEWILYMLDAVEETAIGAVKTITAIREAMQSRKEHIRHRHKFYSQDLLNSIFQHPYTKIEFMQDELKVSRPTATKYLEELTASGVLAKEKRGRSNYYINTALWAILIAERE